MNLPLLILNAGSSSIKFAVFAQDTALSLRATGRVTGIGTEPVFQAERKDAAAGQGRVNQKLAADATHEMAFDVALGWLREQGMAGFSAVAHRVVHGGSDFCEPELLTPEVVERLDALCPLAPLHQPHNIAGMRICMAKMPAAMQFACFDTAFHSQRDAVFASFALPAALREKGVRRYGFHGLSYAWIAKCLQREHPHLAKGRVVVAHLGNGASLCAMKDGKCVDTTMGMTALDGLPMGTRCGQIDAGAVVYMLRELGFGVNELERVLYNESGLKGLSGISNDVKTLSESSAPAARFALDYFAMRTTQHIAAMAVAVGGMDALVFTGGIGENAKGLRETIVRQLGFMPPFEILVIPADEERGMAESIQQILRSRAGTEGKQCVA